MKHYNCQTIICAVLLTVFCGSLFSSTPNYLYLEEKEINEYLSGLDSDIACIVYRGEMWSYQLGVSNYLMNYDEIYVIDDDTIEWLEEQNFENGKIIFFTKSNDIIDKVMSATGYSSYSYIGSLKLGEEDTAWCYLLMK